MAWVRVALLACAVGVVVGLGQPGTCPRVCSCPLDPRGRRQVICLTGGLTDPLPVLDMPGDAEVLRVWAPPEAPNSLTLGPIFKGHRRLEEISVVGCDVPALGAHSFWGLRRLHTLNVSHNAITAIIDTNFRGADNLHTLDLAHNSIESVPSAVFRHVRNLRHLTLAHNRLPEMVPRMLFGLGHLTTLDLSHNPLGVLPPDRFSDAPQLQRLACRGCGLQALSGELFKQLAQLEVADLRHNRLATFPPVRFSPSVVTLLLEDNHITEVPGGAVSGPPLKTLVLAHNRLTGLKPQAFANSTLATLDLAHNRLAKLRSDALHDALPHLRELRLSANPLQVEQLVQLVPRARQLRVLEVAELGLTRVPGEMLRQSRHLKLLNLSANYLSEFSSAALFATPHLATLDLSRNNFRGLDEALVAAFASMAALEKVWLGGNPWVCQRCHVAAMLDWLSDPRAARHPHAAVACRDDPSSALCLTCSGPAGLAGRRLQLLRKEEVPECEAEAPVWPAWLGGAQGDDPRTPRDHAHALAPPQEEVLTLGGFFGDHMALIVGVGCGMVFALLLVLVAALVLARRHSALYYTEENPGDTDSAQKLMGRNNNDNSPETRPHDRTGAVPRSLSAPRTTSTFPRLNHSTSFTGTRASTTPRSTATYARPQRSASPYSNGPTIATIEEVNSIAGSRVSLQGSRRNSAADLRAPKIVRLTASPLP